MMNSTTTAVITAANGNGTAIEVITSPLTVQSMLVEDGY